eukprot:290680_1
MFNEISIWPENVSFSRFMITGFGLQFTANGLLYPFYFCKTHLQTDVKHTMFGKEKINPFFHLGKQIQTVTATNGIKGLYRGFLWSTLSGFPGLLIHVATYEMCKHQFSNYQANSSNDHNWNNNRNSNSQNISKNTIIPQRLIPFFSGIIAEIVACYAYVPSDVVSQKLQLSSKRTS